MNAEKTAPDTSNDALLRRFLLRRLWRSAAGFWTGQQRYAAWMLCAC
jgi:hypothetical protein